MAESQPKEIFLKDYREPDYWIRHIDLEVDLDPARTQVRSQLKVEAHTQTVPGTTIRLNGEHLKFKSVSVDGVALSEGDYELTETHLILPLSGSSHVIVVENEISPESNTALEGLYMSDGLYCTQCEAHGFRRIAYALDRTDVMATYSCKVIGDKGLQPVLLSNGNPIESGDLPDGRHFVTWEDPHPKPAYLFALVAGDLGCLKDTFTTASGREIDLRIYAEPGNEARCTYAMDALKRSMTWDEERFGLEYDLDIFMIVGVNAFNAGAMENKGLNIFNDKYILADPETATDVDYENIEGIVAHEYFHNWTGNRITCRDWFQLCLKEGLTVYRDQEFTSDMRSRAVKRIEDVVLLRNRQFPEDAGPLSHPVRPASFIEIDNFFTSTVYEKGAELCAMIRTFVGDHGFRKGMDLYFERHDGTAATVEDFVGAMADANGRDFSHFMKWYSQSGTPEVSVSISQDLEAQTAEVTVRQETKPTADQKSKVPLHMPLKLGLLGADGAPQALQLEGSNEAPEELVLELTEAEHRYSFNNIISPVTPSLFRDYSAPIKVMVELSDEQRALLMGHDPDHFNRWEAGNQFTMSLLLKGIEDPGSLEALPGIYFDALRKTVSDPALDDDYVAMVLSLPSEQEISLNVDVLDPDRVSVARRKLVGEIGRRLEDELRQIYDQRNTQETFSPDAQSAGLRTLKNSALSLLIAGNPQSHKDIAASQYRQANNMTDAMGALVALNHIACEEREDCLTDFYERWSHNPVVIDKWFRLHATANLPETLDKVKALESDPVFTLTKPNKVYSLFGAFAHGNLTRLHDPSGTAYRFLADKILQLDAINPEVSASLMEALSNWRRLEPARRALLKTEMDRVATAQGLSKNLYEIVTKTLRNEA